MVLRTSLKRDLVGMASAYPFCMYGSQRKGMYYHDKHMSSCTSGGVTKTAESDYTLMDAGAFPHAIKHGSWRGGGKSQIVCEYFDCPDSAVGPLTGSSNVAVVGGTRRSSFHSRTAKRAGFICCRTANR